MAARKRARLRDGIYRPKSVQKLKSLLKCCGVNYESWGQGYTRTPQQLCGEIRDGESVLIVNNGKLLRQVCHAQADIVCRTADGPMRLVETHQVFKNGAIRDRSGSGRSMSEKIKRKEDPRAAMIRGIQEELGIKDFDGTGLKKSVEKTRSTDSAESYPNLPTEHILFLFDWEMPLRYYKPKGYVEVQKHKKTYFSWKNIVEDEASKAA